MDNFSIIYFVLTYFSGDVFVLLCCRIVIVPSVQAKQFSVGCNCFLVSIWFQSAVDVVSCRTWRIMTDFVICTTALVFKGMGSSIVSLRCAGTAHSRLWLVAARALSRVSIVSINRFKLSILSINRCFLLNIINRYIEYNRYYRLIDTIGWSILLVGRYYRLIDTIGWSILLVDRYYRLIDAVDVTIYRLIYTIGVTMHQLFDTIRK